MQKKKIKDRLLKTTLDSMLDFPKLPSKAIAKNFPSFKLSKASAYNSLYQHQW